MTGIVLSWRPLSSFPANDPVMGACEIDHGRDDIYNRLADYSRVPIEKRRIEACGKPRQRVRLAHPALDAERPDGFDPARITHRTGVAYPVIGPDRGRQHRQRAQPAFGKAGKRGDPAFPSTTYSYSSIKL